MSETYETPAINPQTPSFVILPPSVPCSNCAPIRAQITQLREALTWSLNEAKLTYGPRAYSKHGLITRLRNVEQIARTALAEEEA